ncbi:MAG: molybdopterin-dependent oxidoreductase [Pseudomonadota bacterium]
MASHIRSSSVLTHWGPCVVDGDGVHVTDVRSHPADPAPSALSASLRQAGHVRIEKPAVRRSWLNALETGSSDTANAKRGLEPFVELPWDEVLDIAAAELRRVRDAHGYDAIYGGSYGWGSAGRFHMPSGQMNRFMRQFGGCTDAWGTYSSSAAEAIVPYMLGMTYHQAVAQQTAWAMLSRHCELFVSFGGLRESNTQVTYGGQGPHWTGAWLGRAKAQGVTFLNVSPIRDDFDPRLDARWLAPTPGTDVALMLGLLHTLVDASRHDRAFLDRYCEGWPAFERYLLGLDDQVAKTAEWASAICALPAETIRQLAMEMASKRTFINLSLAVQRQHHGEQTYWMATALAAALGQIGLPGGGVGYTFGAAGNTGSGQRRRRIPGLPVPTFPGGKVISVSRVVEMLESPGEPFDFNGKRDTYPDIRLVYWVGGNVFHHHQDLNRLTRAWTKPETIIVHEPFWTPMAKRADIVLPATTPLERSDLGAGENLLLAMQPVMSPVGEARDDYAIFGDLAERLGFGDTFTEGRTADEWIETLYDEFRTGQNDAPTFEDWQANGTLVHDMPNMGESEQVFLSAFRDDPVAHPLTTPSGRIELFSQTIAGYDYDDCPPHPTWLEPFERLGGDGVSETALHLVSNQPAARLHSQYDHGETSQATKVGGREPCRLHPNDAQARGIGDGDTVRLHNQRGACLATAVISEAVMPGAVQLSTGAWYDPDEHGLCRHGNPNVLTRDSGTSKLSQGPSAHTCLVKVERFAGEPPAVRAFEMPELVGR